MAMPFSYCKTDSVAHLYLSLGSNLGNREQMLTRALKAIAERVGRVERVSSFIETEPWGFSSEHRFLNAVCCVETSLSPMRCLRVTQNVNWGGSARRQMGSITTVPSTSTCSCTIISVCRAKHSHFLILG